jgi:hypothetical protein
MRPTRSPSWASACAPTRSSLRASARPARPPPAKLPLQPSRRPHPSGGGDFWGDLLGQRAEAAICWRSGFAGAICVGSSGLGVGRKERKRRHRHSRDGEKNVDGGCPFFTVLVGPIFWPILTCTS